jgi:hypothetical protein
MEAESWQSTPVAPLPGGRLAPHRRAPTKPLGRPKGEPSTIVNIRIPLVLLERLDRYIDRLERDTGLKANRGMIGRRALELFLESHETRAQR